MLKIILIIIVIAFVLASAFYSGLVTGVGELITGVNNNFISYMPSEVRIFVTMIALGLILVVAYTFVN